MGVRERSGEKGERGRGKSREFKPSKSAPIFAAQKNYVKALIACPVSNLSMKRLGC